MGQNLEAQCQKQRENRWQHSLQTGQQSTVEWEQYGVEKAGDGQMGDQQKMQVLVGQGCEQQGQGYQGEKLLLNGLNELRTTILVRNKDKLRSLQVVWGRQALRGYRKCTHGVAKDHGRVGRVEASHPWISVLGTT